MTKGITGIVVGALALVAGCAPQLPPLETKWRAERNFDSFADVENCRVTTWIAREGQAGWRQANRLYPVVEKRGAAVLVGVMTAPMHVGANMIATPTGDVQVKIDGNPTWTIAAAETPPEVQQGTSSQVMSQQRREQMQAALKNNPYVDAKALGEMGSPNYMASLMSPRTLATSDKATAILAQMRQGGTVSYRKITNGAITSEPVTFPLDGFNAALAECGL